MRNLVKKIVSVATALTVSVWLVGPGVAQAVTAADLQAQIDALLANLATLQAQLTAMGGGTAAACTFTRNLYPGVTGADVQCLQQYLNSTTHKVAVLGAGSPGNETTYYGSRTAAAVSSWQTANGVVCGAYCGYFGPVSQAKYTVLAGGAVCGNGVCQAGETHTSCPGDCPAVTCGNGTCDAGETYTTCPADCPTLSTCQVTWYGYESNAATGACELKSFIGCNSPFKYKTKEECESAKTTTTVTSGDPLVRVRYPNGGETLSKGEIVSISWDGLGNPPFHIKLWKGSEFVQYITFNYTVEFPREFSWSIPDNLSSGNDYKVEVEEVESNVSDKSDASFTIVNSE